MCKTITNQQIRKCSSSILMRFNHEVKNYEIIFNEVSEMVAKMERKIAERWLKGVYFGKICHELKIP